MDQTLFAITNLARERDLRRKSADAAKRRRAFEAKEQTANGKWGDVDFVSMIESFRTSHVANIAPHVVNREAKIQVVVRKRPSSEREQQLLDHDAVTCFNPVAVVHNCKFKVDGITKILENSPFEFDHVFDEFSTNQDIFDYTCRPLVEFVALEEGRGTVFAYGQTGSGKTYTMEGITAQLAHTLFKLMESNKKTGQPIRARCSLFELYGGHCLDLLNERRVCAVREDGHGDVHIEGLKDVEVSSEEHLMNVLQEGSLQRTTRCTEMNADSSRSHAIFNVTLSTGGKLSLIDLAGSERGQDTKNHDATRRNESAAINKSLLALKECIRALDPSSGATRVPYRGSKLTMVLKDAFAAHSKTVMISCVSPAASSSDHTLNTLRYADRIKEKVVGAAAAAVAAQQQQQQPSSMASLPTSVGKTPKSPTGVGSQAFVGLPTAGRKVLAFVGAPVPVQQQQQMVVSSQPRSKSPNQSSRAVAGQPFKPIRGTNTTTARAMTNALSSSSSRDSSFVSATEGGGGGGAGGIKDDDNDDHDDMDDDDLSPEHIEILRQASIRRAAAAATTTPGTTLSTKNVPHESVQALIDEEERVLAAHLDAVQKNARILSREGELLEMVQGTVDYDIEQYAGELEALLDEKIDMLQRLRFKVTTFRQNLALEADAQCL